VAYKNEADPATGANIVTINSVSNQAGASLIPTNFQPPVIYEYISSSFVGGVAAPSHGLIVKLSGSYEAGSLKRSFYTKKLFARSSQYYFYRPHIEARWDVSTKDDRGSVYKSSSLASLDDNLNTIYLYNRQRNGLADLPGTGSHLLVSLMTSSIAGTPVTLKAEGGVSTGATTFITASRVSKGVYKAQFSYDGSENSLYDMWYKKTGNTLSAYGVTGSVISVKSMQHDFYHYNPSYLTKIVNLKPAYSREERITFRVFTRDKNWQPNLYTKATSKVPVSTIRDGFYKIKRVADNLTVIPYSTGSSPSYSSLSYDVSGSFFDLDMSLLESNYLYEISFLYKFGNEYIEQKERFKFRVDS